MERVAEQKSTEQANQQAHAKEIDNLRKDFQKLIQEVEGLEQEKQRLMLQAKDLTKQVNSDFLAFCSLLQAALYFLHVCLMGISMIYPSDKFVFPTA